MLSFKILCVKYFVLIHCFLNCGRVGARELGKSRDLLAPTTREPKSFHLYKEHVGQKTIYPFCL